ncbi:hypothetical protein [Pedococcus sp. P5_B7]
MVTATSPSAATATPSAATATPSGTATAAPSGIATPSVAPRSRWRTAALLGAAGVLLGAGGNLHPHGHGETVDDYLASMLGAPTWPIAHLLLLAGTLLAAVAFLVLSRNAASAAVRRWARIAAAGWVLGGLEGVPHLLADRDLDGLTHHHETPVLDLHAMLQVGATPLLGLTGAALAVVVALAVRTRSAWVLAVPAVVGGLGYAVAGPLINLTHDVGVAGLFPLQAGLALWLVGAAALTARGRLTPSRSTA